MNRVHSVVSIPRLSHSETDVFSLTRLPVETGRVIPWSLLGVVHIDSFIGITTRLYLIEDPARRTVLGHFDHDESTKERSHVSTEVEPEKKQIYERSVRQNPTVVRPIDSLLTCHEHKHHKTPLDVDREYPWKRKTHNKYTFFGRSEKRSDTEKNVF